MSAIYGLVIAAGIVLATLAGFGIGWAVCRRYNPDCDQWHWYPTPDADWEITPPTQPNRR